MKTCCCAAVWPADPQRVRISRKRSVVAANSNPSTPVPCSLIFPSAGSSAAPKTSITTALVFLDGRNDLYLPILHLLEPRLLPSGLVVADLSAGDPDLLPYLEYVREPARGYFSTTVPLDDGVELSTREGNGRP
jgi:hypothetical protein